ncbi:cytochrome P450 71A1-like [Hordeum vulgare]|nr:cytochrome P450 71A1-like [Hordeum vulgare]
MEQPLWGSVFVVLVTLLFLKAVFRGGRRRYKYNLPPGPKPCPIIGNLNLIGTLPHRSIHALSKRYGPLMYLRFGYFPVVVGSSVEMARFFLKTRDVVFVDRPKTAAGKYSNYNYGDITWSPYGAYWRQARKICLTELFSAKRLDSLEYIGFEEMRALLSGLQEASGRVVLLKDYLSTLSLNVMMRMVLGNKCLDKGVKEAGSLSVPTPEELKWMVNEFFFLSGVHNIGDSIPWLGWLDLQGYVKRMKKLSKMFDRFLEQVVDEHTERRRLQGEGFVASDFLDVLLEIASDPNLEVKISREGIKAFTQDLIVGAETSASTVEWAISEILMKPEVFAKATEELDRIVGRRRWVTEKDIPSLPYVEAIVKETMRMHPGSPMLSPRVSREDASIAGYDIPAGTRVFINVWAIAHDPALWEAPEEFMPERFLGRKIDVKGQDFELLPFGSGRRMCPGYNLGLKMIQVSIANLLHGFAWRLPDGMAKEELSMEETFGLTTPRKFPLEVVFEIKLPAHLYAGSN